MKTIIGAALAAVVVAVPACWHTGADCNSATGHPLRTDGNRSPIERELPDRDMLVGDTVKVDLRGYYRLPPGCVEGFRDDPYHGPIPIFEATSSGPAVAVWIAADLTTLGIAAREAADSVRVTVVSVLPDHSQEFVVRVRAR